MLNPLPDIVQKQSGEIQAFVNQHGNKFIGYGILLGDFTENELRSAGLL